MNIEDVTEIPKNRILDEKKCGSKVISIRRKYVNLLNQVCSLDSNYEYDYALWLDHLYEHGKIAGWIRNTTRFAFSKPIESFGKTIHSHCPDFIVFNLDGTYEIHEVKGWENERTVKVLAQFKKDYANLTYKMISKEDLKSIQQGIALWGWVKI